MAETQFTLVYDGPALAEGRIPVRDLAPSLFALGELFDAANQIVNPTGVDVSLDIRATADGSFNIYLALRHLHEVVNVFSGDEVTAIVNLRDLVITAGGVLWFIREVRGRPITREVSGDEPDTTTVELGGQASLTIRNKTLEMFRSVGIRRRARVVVAPLERDGITEAQFRQEDEEVTITLGEPDVPAFDVPSDTDDREWLTDDTVTAFLRIVSPVLTGEVSTWRFHDGQRPVSATVEDPTFLERVERGTESFTSGDTLECRVRVRQYRTAQQIRSDWTIVRVVNHHKATPQLPQPTLELDAPPDRGVIDTPEPPGPETGEDE